MAVPRRETHATLSGIAGIFRLVRIQKGISCSVCPGEPGMQDDRGERGTTIILRLLRHASSVIKKKTYFCIRITIQLIDSSK